MIDWSSSEHYFESSYGNDGYPFQKLDGVEITLKLSSVLVVVAQLQRDEWWAMSIDERYASCTQETLKDDADFRDELESLVSDGR